MKLISRCTPYEYESLPNYISRLAKSNFCTIRWMCDFFEIKISKIEKILNCNSDNLQKIVGRLASKTGLEKSEIIKMTLELYKPYASLSHTFYCPQCLGENHYHRIYWCLEKIKVCHIHNTYLLDQCTNCGQPVSIEDIIYGKCSCGQKLNECDSILCDNQQLINLQLLYYRACEVLTYELNKKVDIFYHLKKREFLEVYDFIYSFVKYYYSLISHKLNYKDLDTEDGLKNEICKIFVSWPTYLYYLMDTINNEFWYWQNYLPAKDYRKKVKKVGNFDKEVCRYNPSLILKMPTLSSSLECGIGNLPKAEILYKAYLEYFEKNFGINFLKQRLLINHIKPCQDNYLSAIEVYSLFVNNIFFKQFERKYYDAINIDVEKFKTSLFKKEFVLLEDVFNFIGYFLEKGKFLSLSEIQNPEYYTILRIYGQFKTFGIDYNDIFDMVKKYNLQIKIDATAPNVLSMFLIDPKEIDKLLTTYSIMF